MAELPRKSKILQKQDRYFVYLVAHFQGATFVRKRSGKDIWQNLWEFPLLELPAFPADNRALTEEVWRSFFAGSAPADRNGKRPDLAVSKPYRQILTHRVVTAVFCEIKFPDGTPAEVFEKQPFGDCHRLTRAELKKNIALPRVIDRFLKESVLTLTLI